LYLNTAYHYVGPEKKAVATRGKAYPKHSGEYIYILVEGLGELGSDQIQKALVTFHVKTVERDRTGTRDRELRKP